MPKEIRVNLDPDSYLGLLRQSLDFHMANLRNTLRGIDDGSYSEKSASPSANAVIRMQLSTRVEQNLGAAAETARNSCFLDLTRELIAYLDRMIAVKRCRGRRIRLPFELSDVEARRALIEKTIEDEYRRVASDGSITNPKKVGEFPDLADLPKRAALSYFAIRRALEHHGGVAREGLALITIKLSVLADGRAITALPCHLPKGTQIGLSIDEAAHTFERSQHLALSEEDLEQVCFTISYLIAPDVRRALCFPEKSAISRIILGS